MGRPGWIFVCARLFEPFRGTACQERTRSVPQRSAIRRLSRRARHHLTPTWGYVRQSSCRSQRTDLRGAQINVAPEKPFDQSAAKICRLDRRRRYHDRLQASTGMDQSHRLCRHRARASSNLPKWEGCASSGIWLALSFTKSSIGPMDGSTSRRRSPRIRPSPERASLRWPR
jgi:hypothetical protein